MRKIILSTILLMLTTIMLASCSGNADARQADTFKTSSGIPSWGSARRSPSTAKDGKLKELVDRVFG